MQQTVSRGAAIIGLATIYFCSGKLGLSLAFLNASATPVWPPTGIALAALLLFGQRLWPGIFIGAFLVNLTINHSLFISAGITVGNTLEAVVGAWLVRRFACGCEAFDRGSTVFRYVGLAALLSTAISATLGAASLFLGKLADSTTLPMVWLTWWMGDMVSAIVLTPLLVIWVEKGWPRMKARRWLEAAALLALVFLIGQTVFGGLFPQYIRNNPVAFAVMPLFVWAAFRFGRRGTMTAAFILAAVAIGGALRGFGPFVRPSANESLLILQAFIAIITATTLAVAAILAERKRACQRLSVQHAVSQVLTESRSLETAASGILRAVCESSGWETGALWQVSARVNKLQCVEHWQAPSRSFPEFAEISRNMQFTPGIGLPGRVWASGKVAWISDVTRDSNFPRAPFAAREGLHAALGFPIRLGNEIVGVMEFFSQEIRQPDEDLLQMMATIGNQIGQCIERTQAEIRVVAFSALGHRLSFARTQAEAAEIVVEVADNLFGWDACSFESYSPEKNLIYSLTKADVIDGERKKLSPCRDKVPPPPRMMETIREGAQLILREKPAFTDDTQPFGDVSRPSASIMIVPVRSGERVIGIIAIHSYKLNAYTRADLDTLQSLADHCAGALERIQAEEKILQLNEELETRVRLRTEQLEASNKELEAFGYSVSHDLRAPLRAVTGFSQILQENHAGRLDDEGKECLKHIHDAGKRMSLLIEDLLRLSRILRAEMVCEKLDLRELAKQVVDELQLTHPEREVKFSAPRKLPASGDPRLLGIALQNLIGNAWKFTARSDNPKIEFGVIKENGTPALPQHPGETGPVYFVRDNGAGFDMAYADRLFGVFQRLHSGNDFPGTGIGLATVQRIVRRHGGKIWAEGKINCGATFYFTLNGHTEASHLCQEKN